MNQKRSASPIRVALIGYGLGGRVFHAPLIASTPGMQLAAIVTRNAERREQAKRDFPDARIVDSAHDLFGRPDDLELVAVASPNRAHAPQARAALEAGLHVVVDKPFATTAAEARQVIDDAARHGRIVVPFQNRRWDGDFITVRRLIAEGAFGEVLRFESRFERWRPTPRGDWRESADPSEAGGLLFDLGAHLVDQALTLFGPVTQVYAEANERRAGVHAEDDAFIAMLHASGVRSHLWMNALVAQAAARLRVVGRQASYAKYGLDGQEDALRAGKRPGDAEWGEDPSPWGQLATGDDVRVVRTERGAYEQFYAAVAAAIRDGAPPPVDARGVVHQIEIIEAAHRAAAENRILSL
jgi:predicted dehydrogenase